MPKIIDLPVAAGLDGTETVVLEKDGETSRTTLREYLDATGLDAGSVRYDPDRSVRATIDNVAQVSMGAGRVQYAPILGQGERTGVFDNAAGSGFRQWLATCEAGSDGWIAGVEFIIADASADLASLDVKLIRAPDDVGDDAISHIGDWSVLTEQSETAASLGLGGGTNVLCRIWFNQHVRSAKRDRYGFLFTARSAAGAPVTFGFGNGQQSAGTAAFFQGGFATAIGTNINNVAPGTFIFARPLMRSTRTARGSASAVVVSARKESALRAEAFTRLGFNSYFTVPTRVSGLVAKLNGIAPGTLLKCRIVRRPAAIRGSMYDPAIHGDYIIGADPADQLVATFTIRANDIYHQRFAGNTQTCTLNFPSSIDYDPGEMQLLEVAAVAADGLTPTTMRTIRTNSFVPVAHALEYGSYSLSNVGMRMQNMGDSSLGFKLLGELLDSPRPKRLGDVPVPLGSIPVSAPGLTLALPAINIDALDNPRHIPAQTLTFDGVGAPTLVETTFNLRYNEWNALPARRWASMDVTRMAGGGLLVRGVDYQVNDFGAITGLVNTPDFAVKVSQQAYRMRVDTVMCAPFGETLEIAKGAGRYSDADNWQKEPTASDISKGRVEICRVLVKNDGLEILDRTGAVPGSILFVDDDDYLRPIVKHNKKALRPFRAMLGLGSAADITVISYADSNQANGGGQEAAWQAVPGGQTRDRREHFTIQQGDDNFTDPACPVYTPLLDGDAGPALHVHASTTWRTVQAINAAYGCTITVKNLSIGGSDSGAGGTGVPGSVWGGANGDALTGRLAGLLAAKGTGVTLVFVMFGTNDADNEELINNLAAISTFCFKHGMIPVIIGQPVVSGNRAYDWAKRQETRMMRAAMSTGAAFIPLSVIHHERRNRGIFFPSLENGAGGINHYGLWEHLRYSQLAVEMLLP